MSIIETFSYYLSYPFVQYALIVGVLIALCSSLFGVSLVLKRFSFIGDGLSHVAFGAMAIATVLNFSMQTPFIMIITIIAAVLLLRTGQNTKIKGDAAVAMFSVGSLAIGYLLMNVFSTSTNVSGDVCSTLFGSTTLLTLTKSEVVVCIIMSLLVVGFYIFFYNRIFAVTFDENFMKATGLKAEIYNLFIAVITAIIIVLAMKLVGSLLISALLIFPALSAMRAGPIEQLLRAVQQLLYAAYQLADAGSQFQNAIIKAGITGAQLFGARHVLEGAHAQGVDLFELFQAGQLSLEDCQLVTGISQFILVLRETLGGVCRGRWTVGVASFIGGRKELSLSRTGTLAGGIAARIALRAFPGGAVTRVALGALAGGAVARVALRAFPGGAVARVALRALASGAVTRVALRTLAGSIFRTLL